MKILHKILLLVLAPLGVMTLYYVIEIDTLLDHIEHEAQVQLALKSEAISRDLSNEAEHLNTFVGILRDDLEFGAFAEAGDTYSLFQRTKRVAELEQAQIVFSDTHGVVISRSHDEYRFGDDISQIPLIKDALTDTQSFFIGRLDDELQFAIFSPLRNAEGDIVAYVSVGKSLVSLLKRLSLDYQVKLQVAGLDDTFSSNDGSTYEDRLEYAEVRVDLPMQSRITLSIWEDYSSHRQQVLEARNSILAFSFGLILVLLLAAVWLSKRITNPLVELAQKMSSMSVTNPTDSEAQHSANEISALTASFYRMNAELDRRHEKLIHTNQELTQEIARRRKAEEHLEEKVATRTKELEQANDALNREKERVEKLAATDRLTGINNRLKFEDVMRAEIERSIRYDNPLSVIIIDLDHFKSVNDTYGHLVGDQVLVNFAQLLMHNVRSVDSVARWGGEEFAIICTESDQFSAQKVAEKIRVAIHEHQFPHGEVQTASFGVATRQSTDTADSLISRADEALYRAKNSGRNKVEVS